MAKGLVILGAETCLDDQKSKGQVGAVLSGPLHANVKASLEPSNPIWLPCPSLLSIARLRHALLKLIEVGRHEVLDHEGHLRGMVAILGGIAALKLRGTC